MPSYIHGWCTDCVKRGGCGRDCAATCNTKGPAGCSNACPQSGQYTNRWSTGTASGAPYYEMPSVGTPFNVSVTGLSVTSTGGDYTVPSFSLTRSADNCSHYRWAKCKSNDTGDDRCCDVYLPDGYASVSEATGTPVFTNATGACRCSQGGGSDTSPCNKLDSLVGEAYPQLLETFEHDGTAGEYAMPAFFCTQDGATFYQDPEFEAGETTTALNSACLEPSHEIRLYGAMDGFYTDSADGGYSTGTGAEVYHSGVQCMIPIRQEDVEDNPYAYVSIRYWLHIHSIGTMPSIAGGGAGTVDDLAEWYPQEFRVTYRKQISGCGCIPTGTYTYYSSAFHIPASFPGTNCRCSKGFATDAWEESCHCCTSDLYQGNCPCPDWAVNGPSSTLCQGPNGWYNQSDCMSHYWDETYNCPASNQVLIAHCDSAGAAGGECDSTMETRYETLSCVSGCYNTRKCVGEGSSWAGGSIGAYQKHCDPCGHTAGGSCSTNYGTFVDSVPTDTANFDHTDFSVLATGTCTVSAV